MMGIKRRHLNDEKLGRHPGLNISIFAIYAVRGFVDRFARALWHKLPHNSAYERGRKVMFRWMLMYRVNPEEVETALKIIFDAAKKAIEEYKKRKKSENEG